MACKCKNEDGTLSVTCRGTCNLERTIIECENQSRDSLNGFAELILSQVERRIDQRILAFRLELQSQIDEKVRESFLEGIRQGFRLCRDENEGLL